MNCLIILAGIAAATIIWPLNRVVARHNGRTEIYCFWTLIISCAGCGILTLFFKQNINLKILGMGTIAGMCYACCLYLVMFCLRRGKAGPTVTITNMGLLWPVIAGIVYFNPRIPSIAMIIGIVAVCAGLIILGFSKSTQDPDRTISGDSTKMTSSLFWGMLSLWVMSGIFLTAQSVAGNYLPQSPVAVLFIMNFTASLAFLPAFIRYTNRFKKLEFGYGVVAGLVQIVNFTCVLLSVQRVGAELTFTLMIASPIILMLLIGHFILRERLSRLAWFACIIGVVGLVLMSIAR